MAVSDAEYGKADRYVSSGRLQGMLDTEFQLNVERLGHTRGDENCFFAFADTVVARSFRGGNECHGWMGVKFQAQPHDEPSQIVMHVRMLDVEAWLQQEALGIVGVNLLYGALFQHHEPDKLIENLLDRLTTGRVEIDMIQFRGIEFRRVDNRLMALKLVQVGPSPWPRRPCGCRTATPEFRPYHPAGRWWRRSCHRAQGKRSLRWALAPTEDIKPG